MRLARVGQTIPAHYFTPAAMVIALALTIGYLWHTEQLNDEKLFRMVALFHDVDLHQIAEDESDGRKQAEKLVEMLLAFAEKNPGMVRVMTGDALVGEHERLQARMNQFFDRFESTLKQSLRVAADGDAAGKAGALLRYSIGCLHQYAKSGFAKKPVESFASQRKYLLD